MAKSARASTRKANRTSLRRKVFGPVEDARTTRLADRLLNLASSFTAGQEAGNNATPDKDQLQDQIEASAKNEAMVIDEQERKLQALKARERRDRRERRKALNKKRSSTTFHKR